MSLSKKSSGAGSFARTPEWLVPSDILDVVVVGGGQSGLAIAFALKRAGIDRVLVVDAAPKGQTGIWSTTARMETLRTPKTISGPEGGLAELSFRAWHEAEHGIDAYDRLGRIPVRTWQLYLDWFEARTRTELVHGHRLVHIAPAPEGVLCRFETDAGPRELVARKLVLATGVDGLGGPYVPQQLRDRFDPRFWTHTADPIDFKQYVGRDIGVVGGSASAFDAAATALAAGARSVHLMSRSAQLAVAPETQDWAGYSPVQTLHHLLSDAERWEIVTTARRRGSVPAHSVARAQAHTNFHLHLAHGIDRLDPVGGGLVLRAAEGPVALDHLIVGTGYRTDLSLRLEFSQVLPAILLWKHRHPISDPADLYWGEWPYLGDGFRLLPRDEGTHDWVRAVHVFTYAAILSHGLHVGDIASASIAVPRLVDAITQDLFLAHRADYAARALAGAKGLASAYAQGTQ